MTKQEFLAMSLPYGIIAMINQENIDGVKLENRFFKIDKIDLSDGNKWPYWTEQESFVYQFDCSGRGMTDYETLPILHPLSDLTKPITHNGETFVPIVELAKLTYPRHEWDLSQSRTYVINGRNDMTFEYDYGYNCFLCNNSAQLDQLKCLLKLISWHFDIYELISKNEAIDINTLEVNPYA